MIDEQYFQDYRQCKGITLLPVFDGYLVDVHSREFRCSRVDGFLHIIPFQSDEGELWLASLLEYLETHDLWEQRLYKEIRQIL